MRNGAIGQSEPLADCSERHAALLPCDLRQRFAARPVGTLADRIVGLFEHLTHRFENEIKRWTNNDSLLPGVLPAPRTRVDQPLHPIAESFASEVNLSDDRFPRFVAGSASVGDEPAIRFMLLSLRPGGELRERPVDFEPVRLRRDSGRCPIVAPRIISGELYGATSNRVENYVADQLDQVRFTLDENPLESSLEKVTGPPMNEIELAGVDFIEAFDSRREGWQRGLDEQMIVIRHQNVCVKNPAVEAYNFAKEFEEESPVVIIAIDIPPLVSAAGDMPYCTGMLEAKRTRHL